MKLCLDVALVTDTCLANGRPAGNGDVNTSTEVDDTGLPILRGRTLKGLLVEEAAGLLHALSSPQHLVDAAAALFGEPARYGSSSVLSLEDGTVPAVVRSAFTVNAWKPEVLTTIRRQTSIDAETGGARSRSFRSTRLVRSGVVLRSAITASRDLSAVERGFLAACVVALRRIGLHRNEGWGCVRCCLRASDGVDCTGDWLRLLDSSDARQESKVVEREVAATPAPVVAMEGRVVVEFDIVLERPALFAERSGGNWVTSSLPYIPGSVLLGACANLWLTQRRCPDASADEGFRQLFLDGSTRWLNAYPLTGSTRSVPVPVSWRLDDQLRQVLDLAHPEAQIEEGGQAGNWKARAHRDEAFAVYDEGQIVFVRPKRIDRLHHERDREKGASKEGELFVYDALQAGQQFRAAVLCDAPELALTVKQMIDGAIFLLGRSRSAGYGGGARIVETRVVAADNWCEAKGASEPSVLWLVSDYLGRSKAGTADPAALLGELAEFLGLPGESLQDVRVFLAHRVVHGSVGRWHMPRPPHPAVVAGSVIVLPEHATIDRARIDELLWRGIGERRTEGFGRIAILPIGDQTVIPCHEASCAWSTSLSEAPFPGDEELVARVRQWVGVAELRIRMLDAVGELAARLDPRVAPTLIAWLRGEMRKAKNIAEVRALLEEAAPKRARDALARVGSGQSFEVAVLSEVDDWKTRFAHELPKGVNTTELEPIVWELQQQWLDAVLDDWRRKAQDQVQ